MITVSIPILTLDYKGRITGRPYCSANKGTHDGYYHFYGSASLLRTSIQDCTLEFSSK